jgi:hypothetical protein
MVAQAGYSVVRQSGCRMILCAVCTVLVEMRSVDFLVELQNQSRQFLSGLASKPLRRLSVVWSQNYWNGFLQFGLKTGGDGFFRFGLKISGGGFPGLGLKTGSYGLVIWVSKSPRRFLYLGLKIKWTTVCRLCHKIDRRMKMSWGTRRDLATCFA